MQPFSRETIDRADKLAQSGVYLQYPNDIRTLNRLSGYTSLWHINQDRENDQIIIDAMAESAEAINAEGIYTDISAHQYMDAVEASMELWKPLKAELDKAIGDLKTEYETRFHAETIKKFSHFVR